MTEAISGIALGDLAEEAAAAWAAISSAMNFYDEKKTRLIEALESVGHTIEDDSYCSIGGVVVHRNSLGVVVVRRGDRVDGSVVIDCESSPVRVLSREVA